MCTAYVDDSADDDADDEDENDGDDDDDDDDDDNNDDEDKVNVTLRSKFLWCVQAVGNPGRGEGSSEDVLICPSKSQKHYYKYYESQWTALVQTYIKLGSWHYLSWLFLGGKNYAKSSATLVNNKHLIPEKGLVNVPNKHHPTSGDIIFNKYSGVIPSHYTATHVRVRAEFLLCHQLRQHWLICEPSHCLHRSTEI